MTPETRNAKMDQFFPSRKPKALSPSGKISKVSREALSSNTKGSLDGYLLKSPDARSSPSAEPSLKKRRIVEQKLTYEIKESSSPSNNVQESNKLLIKPCLSNSQLSPVKGKEKKIMRGVEGSESNGVEALQENKAEMSLITTESPPNKHISPKVYITDTEILSTSDVKNGNLHSDIHNESLNQFADSFLAMCCSGVVLKDDALLKQDQGSEQLEGNKRSGSPHEPSANASVFNKKHCTAGGHNFTELHTESINVSEEKTGKSKEQIDMKNSHLSEIPSLRICDKKGNENSNDITVMTSSKQPSGIVNNHKSNYTDQCSGHQAMQTPVGKSGGCSERNLYSHFSSEAQSLKKCSITMDKQTEQNSTCTPKSVSAKVSFVETPVWTYRSSLSPGDEFWKVAIQVADGLCTVKEGNAAIHTSKDFICEGVQIQQRDLQSETKEFCRNSEMMKHHINDSLDRLKHDFIKNVISKHKEIEALPQMVVFPKIHETAGDEKSTLLKSVEYASSPLPVKHFDFNHEEPTIMDGLSDIGSAKYVEGGDHCSQVEKKGSSEEGREHVNQSSVTNLMPKVSPAEENCVYDTKNNDINTSSRGITSDSLMISNWLPQKICHTYAKKGVTTLYPWQVECLQLSGVLERRNLVYCASTSAGKSLVAEILLLRQVLSTEKRALLVLPFVSLCAEKAEHLEKLLDPFNKRVRSFYGSQGSGTLPSDTSVAVCTIEKANSLINRLLEEDRLGEVGIMVIDELHMVGDLSRGYLLELMLTKLRYATGEEASRESPTNSRENGNENLGMKLGMQIVGMSATMPNVAAVANWLQAAFYETKFRPVPLDEYIKVGNLIHNKAMEVVRSLRKGAELGGKDPDHMVELCNEVVQEGHSVLVFCSSRKACETTAKHIAKFIREFSCQNIQGCSHSNATMSVLEELRKSPAGLDPTLAETVPVGVAYHHAGLTIEEREIIEMLYRQGVVKVLTATSTLAAGVNLPARRVIFRQPKIGRDFLDGTRYKQMSGRAGRAGIDTKGESIIICKPEEVKRIMSMLNESCPPLQSCLAEDKNGMKRAILEVVAGGIVQTASDVHRYVRCTLLNSTQPFEDVVKSAQDSLYWLCHAKFLEWDQQTQMYCATPLGRAAFGSSLSPEESMIVFEDLARAREGFVLASDLHLLYEVTPINIELEPDWELFYQRFMELSPLDQAVGNRVGVMEPFLMRMAHGAPVAQMQGKPRNKKSPRNKNVQSLLKNHGSNALSTDQALRVCRRFFVALILARLVEEVPLNDVCESFKVPRGMIQALQENAGRFASMVCAFCERLGWHDLEGLFSKFQNRVSFGVRAEIAELTSIPFVKGARARALYKSGLRTPQAVAEASIKELVEALFRASSSAAQDGSRSEVQHRIQFGIAKKIKNGARKVVLDQAEDARKAAFTAFSALGVTVPVNLSQPVNRVDTESDSDVGEDILAPDEENTRKAADAMATYTSSSLLEVVAKENTEGSHRLHAENSIRAEHAVLPPSGQIRIPDNSETSNLIIDISVERHKNDRETESHKDNRNFDNPNGEGIPVDNSLFAGSKMELKASHVKPMLQEKDCVTRFSEGPVNVDNLSGGFYSFIEMWEKVSEFFFDLHYNMPTKNLSVSFEIVGLAVCWESSPVYYIEIAKMGNVSEIRPLKLCNSNTEACDATQLSTHTKDSGKIAQERWNRIASIMHTKGVKKVTWNLKNQLHAFRRPTILMPLEADQSNTINSSCKIGMALGRKQSVSLEPIDIEEPIDISIVAWMLWPDDESAYGPTLEQEVRKRLPGEVAAAANRAGRWLNQLGRVAQSGCCRRVAQVRALHFVLWKLVVAEGLHDVLQLVEMPLVRVLVDMENWGIGVNMDICREAKHVLEKKLKELENKAYALAGVPFSLAMPADIANILYGVLKLPVPQGCKIGKQHPSTDKHVLDMLRHHHPIVGVIKEHRTLSKLLQCTVISVLSRARLSEGSQVHSVHGHWLQTSTATGRLSMEEPNLQRVEHGVDFTIESKHASAMDDVRLSQYQINAREMFVPTQENWLLISADYSQIELRLMAHFSNDSSLVSFMKEPNSDVFITMAARWTGQNESEISEKQRDQTKKLVYGILYGMSVNTLADQLECSVGEATEKYERFKLVFPGVASWLQQAVDRCRQKGHIRTLSGRKRYLEKINFGKRGEQARAERQAVNSICQGSAADIIKKAMLKVHEVITGKFTEETSNFSGLKGNCHLLLQIHDELLLEVKPEFLREAAALIRSSMEGAASIRVPLRVKIQVGHTWGSLNPYNESE